MLVKFGTQALRVRRLWCLIRAIRIINSDDLRFELPVSANCDTLRARRRVLTERFLIQNVLKSDFCLIICCRKCVITTSLIDCVMRKHLKFYQHEQKDSVNHSYRIVLLITNSAYITCVNDFVIIRTTCILTFQLYLYTYVKPSSLLLQDEID